MYRSWFAWRTCFMKSPQSSQMDLGSPFALFSVCVLTICLLGAARCSNDKNRCPCPEVPKRNLTLPVLETEKCFEINHTFRYKCKGGNVRKVGTSGLIKCTQIDNDPPHWVPPNLSLKCIPDPRRTTTQPPESTATNISCQCPEVPRRHHTLPPIENCFQINQDFRYTCEEGTVRKSGTSGLIQCTQIDNDPPHWVPSDRNFKCIPDPRRTTTQPPESTATTAASSSPPMTQSLSPSASVPAEPGRPEPTSPGLQALSGLTQAGKYVRKTETTHQTKATSTTAEPSNKGAHRDAPALPPAASTVIGCASVVIVCALIGIGFYCYRRRSNSDEPPQTAEESMAMNPSEH